MDNMKIFNLTHADLDGITCAIILKKIAQESRADFSYQTLTYKEIHNDLPVYIDNSVQMFDKVFLTDVSVAEDSLATKKIREYNNIFVIDHHISSKHLVDCSRARINTTENCCASQMVYDMYKDKFTTLKTKNFEKLVFLTDWYDTWKFNTCSHKKGECFCDMARSLNYLFDFYGYAKFLLEFQEGLRPLNDIEKKYLKGRFTELGEFIKNDTPIEFCYKKVIFTVCKYNLVNEVAHYYLKHNKNTKVVVVANTTGNSLSFRSQDNDINLGDVVQEIANSWGFSGGGHKLAAGCLTDGSPDTIEKIIKQLLEKI